MVNDDDDDDDDDDVRYLSRHGVFGCVKKNNIQ